MKASEYPDTNLIKVLAYGNPGTGKTCFAAGFPAPILYFDFDNKVSSAIRFFSKDKERLDNIEIKSLSMSLTQNPLIAFTQEIEALRKMQATGNFPYKTLVIDSITTFSAATLQHIIASNPGIKGRQTAQGTMPDKPHYGILLREFERLIPGLLTLDMNIVMLGHLTEYKNDDTGAMVREVMCDGSFSSRLPIYFDEVYYTYKGSKGEFLAQTQNLNGYACRSQIPGLPAIIPLNYKEIETYVSKL
jgi:hypothetical protein